MSVLRTSFFHWAAPLRATVRSARGISILDLVIAALVLTVILLAAANQSGRYEKSAAPVSQGQTTTADSSATAEK